MCAGVCDAFVFSLVDFFVYILTNMERSRNKAKSGIYFHRTRSCNGLIS